MNYLLNAKNLKKYFPVNKSLFNKASKYVHAVDDVSFSVESKDIIGIVGESGCGKSTLAQLIMGIYSPTSGTIEFEGKSINLQNKRNMLAYKRNIQMVFQDPYWSLNPRKMARDIIAEPMRVHKTVNEYNMDNEIQRLLNMVGISGDRMYEFPHEFSGGERQRIAIARSLSLSPKLLILDEPTSSIDTLSQAGILNLLIRIRDELNLSYLLISHDLSVIHFLSNKIIVMYLGKIVEMGDVNEIFNNMLHPYTKALMLAIPSIDTSGNIKKIEALEGNVPSAINLPKGCRFNARCKHCMDICLEEEPVLKIIDKNHSVACHLY
jgi:oligopeptide/dipeptide ABC transporter ATP-binding protein